MHMYNILFRVFKYLKVLKKCFLDTTCIVMSSTSSCETFIFDLLHKSGSICFRIFKTMFFVLLVIV